MAVRNKNVTIWRATVLDEHGCSRLNSPDKLRAELDLARSGDRGRLQRGIAWNVCSPAVDEGRRAGTEVRPVEQIEGLSPELDLQFLAQQIVVFEERKIEVCQARGAQRVAPKVA